jgi:hypothetical protein
LVSAQTSAVRGSSSSVISPNSTPSSRLASRTPQLHVDHTALQEDQRRGCLTSPDDTLPGSIGARCAELRKICEFLVGKTSQQRLLLEVRGVRGGDEPAIPKNHLILGPFYCLVDQLKLIGDRTAVVVAKFRMTAD